MEPSDTPHACIEPHHHVHGAGEFVRAVERVCRERGLRLTAIRAHRPAGAGAHQRRAGRGGSANGLSRTGFSALQRVHPQIAIGQCVRRLPPSEHGAAFGTVPDLQPLPYCGGNGRCPHHRAAGRARARFGLQAAGADAGSVWPVCRLRGWARIGQSVAVSAQHWQRVLSAASATGTVS